MAGPNVTARVHYDTSHNFYLPVHGRKRFLLLPHPVDNLAVALQLFIQGVEDLFLGIVGVHLKSPQSGF